MNLMIHQFKTDWRHFRGALLVLWGLFAAQLLVPDVHSALADLQGLLLFLQIFFGAFLLARIIQADALVGTSAQWHTRPLGRARLLGAKSLFILGVVVLPRLLPLLVIAGGHHFSFHLLLAGLAEWWLFTLAFALFISDLAALTPDLPRFSLGLGVVLGGFFISLAVVSASQRMVPAQSASLHASAVMAGGLGFIGCALFVWFWQMRPGRAIESWAVLGLAWLVLPWVLNHWTWDFLRLRTAHPPANNLAAVRRFFPETTLWEDRRGYSPGEESSAEVRQALRVALRPGAWTLGPGQRLVIRRLTPKSDGIQMDIELTQADSLFSQDSPLFGSSYDMRIRHCLMVLYQPVWGEADILEDYSSGSIEQDILNGESHKAIGITLPYSALQARLAGLSPQDFVDKAVLYVFMPVKNAAPPPSRVAAKIKRSQAQATPSSAADDRSNVEFIQQTRLPQSPTAAQTAEYLDAILLHLPDHPSEAQRGIIRSRLEAIGSAGVPLLLARLPLDDRTESDYVFPLLTKLASREQLPELREALGRDIYLADWFHQMKWDDDARDILVAKLRDHRRSFDAEALRLAAAAKDPATYAELTWHFVRLPYDHARVTAALAQCPGFDLNEAVREAWSRVRLGLLPPGDLALLAAKQGLPDAFNQAVIQLEQSHDSQIHRQYEAQQIAALTDFAGPPETAPAWLSANLGRFQYEAESHRYRRAGGP